MPRSQLRWSCDVLVVGLVLAVACGPQARTTAALRGGPPASADRTALLNYADSLEYWSRLGAADRRPVDPEGVVAKIEPEVDAYRLTEPELNSGRIVARISKSVPMALPRFGLGPTDTVSYWLVFQKDSQYYGRFFSASADTTYPIKIDWHDGRANAQYPDEAMKTEMPWGQSIAQWRYVPDGGPGSPDVLYSGDTGGNTGWVSCAAFGCCRTN